MSDSAKHHNISVCLHQSERLRTAIKSMKASYRQEDPLHYFPGRPSLLSI